MASEERLVELDDLRAAREVVNRRIHRTTMVTSSHLGRLSGFYLQLKLEMFQKTGSFKARGALNKLHHLSDEQKQQGVITFSAGNHAQALAWAAGQSDIESVVVMPGSSIRSKVDAAHDYGAEVIQTENDLLHTCLAIQEERGMTLVHPFDDLDVIAGQGTLGLEILEDAPDVDAIVVGVGGGGLISGVAAACKLQRPGIHVIGVEPVGAAAMSQSVEDGEPVRLDRINTIADGLAAPFAGKHTLEHVYKYVDDMVTVTDEQIVTAMKLILERCKVLAEPAAAATVAAVLYARTGLMRGSKVVCILGGGNIDCDRLGTFL